MHTTGDHHHPRAGRGPSQPPLRRRLAATVLAAALGLGLAVGTAPSPAGAADATAVTARASVSTTGAQVGQEVGATVLTDTTGRYVAFDGVGAYHPSDTNGKADVHLRDRLTGATTRVSVTDGEDQITGDSRLCGASGDLRYVAFWAQAPNLPGGNYGHVYLRDRVTGTTRLASLGNGGQPSQAPGGGSGVSDDDRCDVSLDGRYVAFVSFGTNLTTDTNGTSDVFRRDMLQGTTVLVSRRVDGNQVMGAGSFGPQISDSGDVVVFRTPAVMSEDDDNDLSDVFVRKVGAGTTALVSRTASGDYANGAATDPAISADGTKVAFASTSTNINPEEPDANGALSDVYVTSTTGAQTTRVSVSSTEVQGGGASTQPSLSVDGRFVAFTSTAANLYPVDGNGGDDVFVRDRQLGLTALASRRVEANATSTTATEGHPSVSADGTAVAFASAAPDLVRNDTNTARDALVRDVDVDHRPFGSFDALVARQFADFAGRAPTTAEATEWRNRLRHGEVSPDQVVTALAHSTAWSQHRGPVTRLYWAFFLRAPDAGGLDYWVAQKTGGKGLHTIAGQFAQSKEFKDTYGPLSNSAFVTLVYQNVLERDPAPSEVAYWKGELDAGKTTRGSVMVGFSESAEGRAFLAPQVDVVLVHLGMLGTIPPKAAFTQMTTLIEGGRPLEELIGQLRLSPSYP